MANIDINKIKSMNDEELANFLKNIKMDGVCDRCGEIYANKDRDRIVLFAKNNKVYNNKKICDICVECYKDILKTLGVMDTIGVVDNY